MEQEILKHDDIFLMLSQEQDWQIIQLSREGIKKRLLLQLGNYISLTTKELSSVLNLSEKTLKRYNDDKKLNKAASEKTIELASLYQHGKEVFGKIERFNAWMKSPHVLFKQQCPIDILDTYRGFQMVHDELGRIEHGVFI